MIFNMSNQNRYSQLAVKSSRQEFARVFSRVPESPCEHAVFQEQSSALEPRVRQGLLNLCFHLGSETLEFARVASIPDLKSQSSLRLLSSPRLAIS